MKQLWMTICSTLTCISAFALSNPEKVYPPINQKLVGQATFQGDRHDEFFGDLVAIFSDGSAWKVHPEDRVLFQGWKKNDTVSITLRDDSYWFSRQHHFAILNFTRKESVRAMLVRQKKEPLKVIATRFFFKDSFWGEFRKELTLSDQSKWVIQDDFSNFTIGKPLYIGAIGAPNEYYDFLLITGDQREALYTIARPSYVDTFEPESLTGERELEE